MKTIECSVMGPFHQVYTVTVYHDYDRLQDTPKKMQYPL